MNFLPGFISAAELVPWSVSERATLVVEEKDPKPFNPRSATVKGSTLDLSVSPVGRSAGEWGNLTANCLMKPK